MTNFSPSREFAVQLDQQDSLASYREQFVVNDPDLIYLDGNSLGRLPKSVIERMKKAVEEEWGIDLIRGWNKGWWEAPTRIGEKIASLIGAAEGEVIAGDQTSINLFKLATAALTLQPQKKTHYHRHIQLPI
jgi:kynureninase